MKIIETAWKIYERKVIPPGAPLVQIVECRRAFYAGAGALLDSMSKVLGPGEQPTDSDMIIMDGIATELREHVQAVLEGKR